MNAMELDFFKMSNLEWIEANNLTPYDVALIVDKEQKAIYFWHGARASMKKRLRPNPLSEKTSNDFPDINILSAMKEFPEEFLM